MGTVLRADASELPDIKLNTIIDNSFQNSPVMASMPPSGLAEAWRKTWSRSASLPTDGSSGCSQ
jgi:hypothetical protein